MTISTIVLVITDVFGGDGETGGSSPKDEGVLKKWLDRLGNALKRLAGKTVEALPAIVGSVVGAILSFLGKTAGIVVEHTWALVVFKPFHDLIKGNENLTWPAVRDLCIVMANSCS